MIHRQLPVTLLDLAEFNFMSIKTRLEHGAVNLRQGGRLVLTQRVWQSTATDCVTS